ncbi:MFS transporter [Salibacterium salarium]|uniref:MFS transporter n=1 Tax=Salibacterium salarium TaxID=284579 RepID=A0A3R9Q599_9BACI|nr:MFS transporter [Salibacterium salarium]RSL33935.1 MFS transporter [Salibacterium salarium]
MLNKNARKNHLILSRNALFVIFALPGIALASWVARTPEVRDALEASTAQMGWIIFGLALGSMVGLLSASRAIARTGARFVTISSILCVIAGTAAIGTGTYLSISMLVFTGLMIFGLGNGFLEVAINLEGAVLERAAHKTLLPALHASFSGGTLLGAAWSALMIALHISVHVHLFIVCVIVTAALLFSYRYLPYGTGKDHPRRTKKEKNSSEHPWKVWKEPRTLLIGLVVLGMAFAEGSANDWLPLAMVDGLNVQHITGSAIFVLFLTAMFIGRIAGGFLIDQFGRVPVLRIASILAFLGLALVILTGYLPVAAIGVFLWGLGTSLGFPIGISAAGDEPEGAITRVSIVSIIGYSAFLVGPPVLGLFGELMGLLNAFVIVLIAIFLAVVASSSVNKPHQQLNE